MSCPLQVFQTFACEEFPEVSKSYLRADQRIECYSATHTAYRTYAGVMIFLCEFRANGTSEKLDLHNAFLRITDLCVLGPNTSRHL